MTATAATATTGTAAIAMTGTAATAMTGTAARKTQEFHRQNVCHFASVRLSWRMSCVFDLAGGEAGRGDEMEDNRSTRLPFDHLRASGRIRLNPYPVGTDLDLS